MKRRHRWVQRIKRRIVRCSTCGWIMLRGDAIYEDVTYCDDCDAWLCCLCVLGHDCDEGLMVLPDEWLRLEASAARKQAQEKGAAQ